MSNTQFRPVRGLEANILSKPYNDGYIYYAIDTKKIYLDAHGQSKILMGGSSGIFYGQMSLDETPDSAQKEFDFTIFDIEGNSDLNRLNIPDVDDLILNIPDGCFYRVTSITGTGVNTVISTEKLTISGGGNNTGPVGPNVGSYSMDRISPAVITTLFGSSYSVGFSIYAEDASGEQTGSCQYRLLIGSVEKERGVIPQGENYLDVSPYLTLGYNEVTVIVSLDIGSSENVTAKKTWQITTTQMKLQWDPYANGIEVYNTLAPLTLNWSVSGVGISKTTYITIDDMYSIQVGPTTSTTTQQYTILHPNEFNLTHGTHKIAMRAGTLLAGATDEDFTPYIYHNLMFKNPIDTSPIIRMDLFNTTLTQYNTVSIPIYFYSEDNITNSATLILKEDGVPKDTWENVANNVEKVWTYTPTVAGTHILSVHCGDVEVSHIINVTSLNINNQEVPGYAFKFKASDFASNSAVQNWKSNGVTASFSDRFDWVNGGLKSEKDEFGNNRQYMAIKAGSTMTINYPLWEKNAPGYGKTFKLIFKATNCRDYDAQVITCKTDKKVIHVDSDVEYLMYLDNGVQLTYSRTLNMKNEELIELKNPEEGVFDLTSKDSRELFEGVYVRFDDDIYECHFLEVEEKENEDDPTLYYAVWYKAAIIDSFDGVVFNAQSATVKSRSNTISTQYCEDTYMELEFDISKIDLRGVKNYIKFWVDGIPSGFVVYDSNDSFTGDNKIIIGSADCDVHIYMLKVYDAELTNDEHLQNFIADAPNAEEMIKRYRRNDILSERSEIDPALLAKANPDCLVHIYDIPRMTKTKNDAVYPCSYQQYHGSNQVKYHAENVMIKVQGTSSEKYVVAAANIDSDFQYTDNGNQPSGLIDTATGNVLTDGWSMDGGTAIPINYACTKVNVASCENANNALNQEWYNMFQPYKTVLRCKNPRARDTMQFTNGVMFMIDHNQTWETGVNDDKKANNIFGEIPGYLTTPYAKMYSLANMGNSKDNIHVFHDQSNPLECCVEVKDNQTQQQWMTSDNYNKADCGEGEKYFEFRYPKKVKKASSAMKDGWNRFVSWMAHSNPSPKYQEHKATSTDDFKKFSFNQKTQKPVPVYIKNQEANAYELIPDFDPNIDTYYTETDHIYGHTNLKLDNPVTFGNYTFRGYRAENCKDENGELWQKDYTPLIAGCTVSTYAGTYTHDTYEYRMAKMLSECEDYLVMDSVIYHYLFIERHSMIDNVAKNTFWSTEDCQHWNLTKDYDNDTSDGNDNNGKFTRTYGMEPLDKLNINTYVFNAHQSVWLNFVHGLKTACDHLYQALESKKVKYEDKDLSVWNYQDYLWLFNKWQSKIPERCWIEDYYRKYFRPYELYADTMFIGMMEGGQKKYQRQQYETYQDIYISSKYEGVTNKSSYVWFRPNGTGLLNHQLPVQVYSDCYIRMSMGSDTSVERVKRNTVAYIRCPVNNANNATMELRPANSFTIIGDVNGGQVADFTPDVASFASAGKLRELVFATENNSIRNKILKEGFSVANNNLLEKLYISHLTSYTQGLNLSGCPNLLEVNAANSSFTSIEIANNAPVTSIVLQSPTSLVLSNLTELNTLDIRDYKKLTGLKINNIDKSNVNSKDIVEAAYANAISENYKLDYTLTDVNWTMNESTDIDDDRIVLLDKLLNHGQPNWNANKTEREPLSISLTGKLLIGNNAYSGSNSFDIYNTYVNEDIYPSLDINFTHSNAKLYTVDIYDGNDKVYWTRKIVKGQDIDDAFLSDGPIGAFNLSKVLKGSTPAYTYLFTRTWEVYNTADLTTKIDIIDNQYNGLPYYDNIQCDITLKPVFQPVDKTYTLTFYGVDVTTPLAVLEDVKYGTPFTDVVDMLTEIPYKEYSGSELKAAYDFVGYALLKDSSTKVPTDYVVANDQSFFAIFEFVSDVSTVVHYEDWFTFTPYAYVQDKVYSDLNIIPREDRYLRYLDSKSAYVISPKAKLKGKITIPAKYNDKPVVAIAGFGANAAGEKEFEHEITHIFCEQNSQLYEISTYAFRFLTTLKYFDFSQNTVRFIDQYAFQGCEGLDASLNSQNESRFQLSSELFYMGAYSFTAALYSPTITELIIPSKVVLIGENGFAYQNVAEGSTLRIGSETASSQLQLLDPSVSVNIITAPRFVQNTGNHYRNIYFFSEYYESTEDIIANGVKVQDIFFGGEDENYQNTTITVRKV